MEKLTRKYKGIFIPLTVSLALLVLTFVSGNFLIGRISTARAEASQIRSKLDILESRIATLQSAATGVRDSVNIAALAIPEKNPSVLVTRQLRGLALERGIVLDEFSITPITSAEDQEGMFVYEVSFNASGPDSETVSNYLEEVGTLLPLLNLESITIKSDAIGGVESEVRLNAYSAAFPASLPSLDEPLSGLSLGEQESLEVLGSFKSPLEDGTAPQPVEIVPKENPFLLAI